MNKAIIELQRDLLLNELMEVENQLNESGIKRTKKGYTLTFRNGVFYVKYTNLETGKQIPTSYYYLYNYLKNTYLKVSFNHLLEGVI